MKLRCWSTMIYNLQQSIKKKNLIFTCLNINSGDYFWFGLVFIKKNNQIELKKKTKPKPNRNRFKLTGFGLIFLDKNQFKLVWLGFFRFFLFGSFRFFWFQAYKTETKPVGFFKILISLISFFFLQFGFSIIFF